MAMQPLSRRECLSMVSAGLVGCSLPGCAHAPRHDKRTTTKSFQWHLLLIRRSTSDIAPRRRVLFSLALRASHLQLARD